MSYASNQRKKKRRREKVKAATTFGEFCLQKNATNYNLLPQDEYEKLISEWGSYKTFHNIHE